MPAGDHRSRLRTEDRVRPVDVNDAPGRANVKEQRDVVAKFAKGLRIQGARRLGGARLANLLEAQTSRDGRIDVVGQGAIEARHAELLDLRGVGRVTELPALDPRLVVEVVGDGEFDGAPRVIFNPAHSPGRETGM